VAIFICGNDQEVRSKMAGIWLAAEMAGRKGGRRENQSSNFVVHHSINDGQ
jgi:hypothetical protein